jgi:hypothetical protein
MRISVQRFCVQETASFECAPQREEYESDGDFLLAVERYKLEWIMKYKCSGCADVNCPQCGPHK